MAWYHPSLVEREAWSSDGELNKTNLNRSKQSGVPGVSAVSSLKMRPFLTCLIHKLGRLDCLSVLLGVSCQAQQPLPMCFQSSLKLASSFEAKGHIQKPSTFFPLKLSTEKNPPVPRTVSHIFSRLSSKWPKVPLAVEVLHLGLCPNIRTCVPGRWRARRFEAWLK